MMAMRVLQVKRGGLICIGIIKGMKTVVAKQIFDGG